MWEELEDTKGVIGIRKSKTDRKHHGKKKTDPKTINDLQKHTHKRKERARRTSLQTGGELMCPGRVNSFCFTSGTRRVNLVIHPVISHE